MAACIERPILSGTLSLFWSGSYGFSTGSSSWFFRIFRITEVKHHRGYQNFVLWHFLYPLIWSFNIIIHAVINFTHSLLLLTIHDLSCVSRLKTSCFSCLEDLCPLLWTSKQKKLVLFNKRHLPKKKIVLKLNEKKKEKRKVKAIKGVIL